MAGAAQFLGTVVAETAGGRVVALGQITRKDTILQGCNGTHASLNLVTIVRIPRTFPFRHPVTGIGHPVRSDTQAGRSRARVLTLGLSQSHGVQMVQQCVGIGLGVHQVAYPFVGSEIIIIAQETRLRNAGLLGTTAPVADIMTAAQWSKRTDMIGVHFAVVTRHGFGHAPDVGSATTQEHHPQPSGRC